MIEIRNKNKGPVQLVIRSRTAPKSFTSLNIPGLGSNKNVYYLEDERNTDYVERLEKMGLITTRHIPSRKLNKGE